MKGALSDLASPGTEITVRVTPRASRERIDRAAEGLRVWVTAPPEDGKANAAVTRVLARALGVPKSRVQLVRGATSRDKCFRILACAVPMQCRHHTGAMQKAEFLLFQWLAGLPLRKPGVTVQCLKPNARRRPVP